MSSVSSQAPESIEPDTLRALITGFGPFSRYTQNPSWLAVRRLHNTTMTVNTQSESTPLTPLRSTSARRVHITALEVPVTYQAVLSTVPGFHARPPTLPPVDDATLVSIPPPTEGYDFIFHVGVAGRGPIRMETLAHKLGYRMKDVEGQYAPIVHLSDEDRSDPGAQHGVDEKHVLVSGNTQSKDLRIGVDPEEGIETSNIEREYQPIRGFGKGYEGFANSLCTDLDVSQLISHLKERGIEQVYSSVDAGHFLCDFIYYCSLAEARRAFWQQRSNIAQSKPTPVLFMHCPPVNEPLSTQEVSEAIKEVTEWVCAKLI